MTSPEHTLVGVHGAFALGLHCRWGWPAVAMAGLASIVPDWDGLLILLDVKQFDTGHRVWGHNLLAIAASSALLGWSQHKYRWIERVWRAVQRKPATALLGVISEVPPTGSAGAFIGIACVAQLIHLPCDMVVSGGRGLSDWPIQPLWPFSTRELAFPLIPWGDIGPTVILMGGAIAMAKRTDLVRPLAVATLVVLGAYLVARG